MNNEKINSKIKLSNISLFNIRNFEISKYWSFYIPSFEIFTHTRKIEQLLFLHFHIRNDKISEYLPFYI